MHLEVTAGAAAPPFSDEVVAERRRRGSGPFPPTPHTLLSRAQRNEPGAFAELAGVYVKAIRSFLLGKGARAHEAHDVTQGTVLGMWRGLGRFRANESGSFRGWLCRIAMRQLSNLREVQAKLARLQEPSAQLELERQLAVAHAQCAERMVRKKRALEIIERVWERVARNYEAASERELFDYLRKSIETGIKDCDVELSRALGKSDGYVAKRCHDLIHVEYPKALQAEHRECRASSEKGSPRQSFREWVGALRDDLG